MDIGAVRQAIGAQLDGKCGNVRIEPTFPDPAKPPFITVIPEPFDYPATLDGDLTITFQIRCIAGSLGSASAQNTLDGWISNTTDTSIIKAIQDDESLGGQVSSAVVTHMVGYGPEVLLDGSRVLATTLRLEVFE